MFEVLLTIDLCRTIIAYSFNLTEQDFDSAHPINKLREFNKPKVHSEQRRDSLARRLRAGELAAATELVDIYYKQIYLFMRRLGHDRQVRRLGEDIKRQIPHRLSPHRVGMDTINIIIDLRINKLAAAAAIIITIVFCATFLGGRDSAGGSVLQDSMLLIKYWGAADTSICLAGAKTLYGTETGSTQRTAVQC